MVDVKSKEEARKFAEQFMELHREYWPAFEGECEVRCSMVRRTRTDADVRFGVPYGNTDISVPTSRNGQTSLPLISVVP